ncbi:MAG: phosphate ABC transporter permease [Acidobacteria bacterium]|nr:MAG: phosphate ABC transporter permease [Acidobacteriota bacterium]
MRTNFSDRIRASEVASPSRTTSNAKTLAAAIHQSHANTQVVIEAEDSGVKLGLADLWRYRELLYFLTWRDVKLRYKQTLLGAAWAIIQPLFAMLLFTMFFGRLARMPSDNIPYPLFAYAGLLPWTFFANAVTSSANSLIGSTNLVTKVYFPRMIIPAAPVLAGLIDLGIGFVLLVPLFIYYRVSIGWHFLFLPVLILLVTLIAFGVGMWMAAINVKYRDVRYALPFLVQLWLFASPVIYPLSLMPPKWRWLLMLNPLTGIVEGMRASLFGRPFDWPAIGISFAVSILIAGFAAIFFQRVEDSFADII